MKAITIQQPYAELIARGEKVIENRKWSTQYRGEIAIHASKSRELLDPDDLRNYPEMAFGAVVATARLIDCVRVAKLPAHLVGNEHANGPWCLLLDNVRRLRTPVPMIGTLGVFTISEDEQQALAEAAQ